MPKKYQPDEIKRVRVTGIEGFADGTGKIVGEDNSYEGDPNIENPYYVEMDDGRTVVANYSRLEFIDEQGKVTGRMEGKKPKGRLT